LSAAQIIAHHNFVLDLFNRMNSLDPKIVNPLNGGSITYQDPITGQSVTRSLLGGEIFASPSDRNNYARTPAPWNDGIQSVV
jgi:hypothetical protein